MSNLHARLYNIQYLSTQPQSFKGVCNLKEANETTGRGIRACMKQQVLPNNGRCPHKCEQGKSATYPNLIYSLLPFYHPPPHTFASLKVYTVFHHDGSPASSSVIDEMLPRMWSPTMRMPVCVRQPPHVIRSSLNKVTASALGAGVWAYGAMFDGCSALSCSYSPSPSSSFSLALIL